MADLVHININDGANGITATVKRDGKMRTYVRTFDSVAAYIKHNEQTPTDADAALHHASITRGDKSRGRDWLGVETVAQVRAAVTTGWAEGAEKIRGAFDEVKNVPVPKSLRRKPVRGDMGDELCPHAILRGDFSHAWTRKTRQTAQGKRTVQLVANILDNATHSASELFWRGAATLKLAVMLVEAGYAVEIYAGLAINFHFKNHSNTWNLVDLIKVKTANAPLDIQNLAGVIGLSGFARYYGFMGIINAAIECAGDAADGGLGSAIGLDVALLDQGDRFVTPRCNTAQDAEKWIRDTLADIEGEVKL